MTRWVLLLRGVNIVRSNRLAMADLRALLTGLGHGDVRTHLNSGNATFTSSRRGAAGLAAEVEQGLRDQLALTVRATVLSTADVRRALDAVPPDLPGYVLVAVLLGPPDPAGLAALGAWEPEVVRPGDGVVYIGYPDVRASRLSPAVLEKHLGVATTSRTPATLRRLVADDG